MKRKIDITALSILIAAAVSCGLIGVFQFSVITWLFGGQTVTASRIIYVLVAAAGLWCLNLIAVQAHRNRKTSSGASDYTNEENTEPAYTNGENTAFDFMNVENAEPEPMYNGYRTPDPVFKPDPWSLKDNPAGETICSHHFSQGCINEDTVSTLISADGDKFDS